MHKKVKYYDITAHFAGPDVEATTKRVEATNTSIDGGVIHFNDTFGQNVEMVAVGAFVCANPTYFEEGECEDGC